MAHQLRKPHKNSEDKSMLEHPEFSKEQIIKLVESVTWYHKYEVYPGVITPGRMNMSPKFHLDCYMVPQDLTGLKVLEIGAFDGAYTFELERRGANVTAMDIQDKDRTGFSVAHRINQSKVKYIQCDVTDLNPEDHGQYDIVMFLGVYYHILHPLLAFQNIFNVLKDNGPVYYSGHILEYSYNIDPFMARHKEKLEAIVHDVPLCHFAREEHAGVWSNWYIPNLLCLNDWLSTAGFQVVRENFNPKGSTMNGTAVKIPNFKLAPWVNTLMIPSLTSNTENLSNYKKVLFFGAGGGFSSWTEEIRTVFDKGVVLGVADNDLTKKGSTLRGYVVVNPDDIAELNPDLIIVTSTYAGEISSQLKDLKKAQNLSFDIKCLCEPRDLLDTSSGHEVY